MYVARDKDERLWLFIDKPIRSQKNGWWEVDTQNSLLRDDDCMEIDGDLFLELRWEDEPLEVELRADDKHDIIESIKDSARKEVLRLAQKWINNVLTQFDITDNGYTIDARDLERNLERYYNETYKKVSDLRGEVGLVRKEDGKCVCK